MSHVSVSGPVLDRIEDAMTELAFAEFAKAQQQAIKVEKKPPGRVLVNIDVHELGPIELEVTLFPKRGRQ